MKAIPARHGLNTVAVGIQGLQQAFAEGAVTLYSDHMPETCERVTRIWSMTNVLESVGRMSRCWEMITVMRCHALSVLRATPAPHCDGTQEGNRSGFNATIPNVPRCTQARRPVDARPSCR